MTIDETIKYYEKLAETNKNNIVPKEDYQKIKYYEKLAETNKNNIVPKEDYQNMPWIGESNEHYKKMALRYSQIAEWLRELRYLRNVVKYSKNHNCSIEQAEKNLLLDEMKRKWREEDKEEEK